MIQRAACPDCRQAHAILESPAGRVVARCTRCRRLWPPNPSIASSRESEPDVEDDAAVTENGSTASDDPRCCNRHPGRRTRFVCERCDLCWCGPCSREVKTHGFDTTLSPCCREGLAPVGELQALRPFWSEIPEVLLYALRGGGPFVLAFLWFGGFVPILAWTIPVFAIAYGVHVARNSAHDPYHAPDFPEPDDIMTDFLYPFLRLIGASLVAFGPLLLYRYYGPDVPNPWLHLAFLVFGLTLYPAILLGSVAGNTLIDALAPGELVQTIRSMGTDYLALVLALGIFVLVWITTGRVGATHDVLALFTRFARFYLLVTAFHVLGRSIWQTRDRIDWGV